LVSERQIELNFGCMETKQRKIYLSIAGVVADSLKKVLVGGQPAARVLREVLFEQKKWGSRDRRMFSESFYQILRNHLLLQHHCNNPDYFKDGKSLIDALYWLQTDNSNLTSALNFPFHILFSINKDLDDFGRSQMGGEIWEAEMKFQHSPAPLVVRVNSIRTSPKELIRLLGKEEIEATPLDDFPDALLIEGKKNLRNSRLFKEGFFEIQDPSSQSLAHYVNPLPGERILDACAGGGGKSLHLASLSGNKTEIVASDLSDKRLEQLKVRSMRNKTNSIKLVSKSELSRKFPPGYFDKVLIDAPCSGSGVIRREPEKKYRLNSGQILKYAGIQLELLAEMSAWLKPQGKLYYATCSIFPAENQQVVAAFLKSSPGFELVREKSILGYRSGHDGFYMTEIIRKS
jgi:16S rRNA (cytosine967-C5)-methyltransferase